ncbi:MAG: gluconate 2-dehydrogenase subunit 3 family protein [Elusimicrobiota bacterium]
MLMLASLLVPRLGLGSGRGRRGHFSKGQERTIKSLLEMIWPGCLEYNAYPFLERWLGSRGYEKALDYYKKHVDALVADSKKSHKKDFAELDQEGKESLLDRIYKRDKLFYLLTRQAALMSVFGDPTHGVNPGKKGWKMIDYSPGSQLPFTHLER